MAAQLKVVVEPTQLVEGVLLQADPSVEIRRVLPGAAQAVDDVRDLSLQDEDGVEDFLLALDAVVRRVVLPSAVKLDRPALGSDEAERLDRLAN